MLTVATGGSLAAMAVVSQTQESKFSKVLIIGGGIAGLSAASHFAKNGMTDFCLLEATDKLGGRIDAFDTGSSKVELGANYIHGVLGNPIYELAMTHGLIDIMLPPKPHKVIAVMENGSHVPFAVLQEIYEAYLCFLRRCEEYFLCQYLPPEGIRSVGEHVRLEIELYLNRIPNQEDRQLRQLIFNCLLKRESCISGCDDMQDVDLLEMGSYTELQGGNIQLPSGYTSILNPITSLIPPRNILLNKPVALVKWHPSSTVVGEALSSPGYDSGIDVVVNGETGNDSDDSDKTMTGGTPTPNRRHSSTKPSVERAVGDGVISKLSEVPVNVPSEPNAIVEVTCEDGTRFTANHVICAVPLGVLKEKVSTLFSPKLPQYKLESINNLSFGTVNKIFLEYSRSFLHPEVSEVMLLWDNDSSDSLENSWFKKIYSFAKVSDTVVLGWVSGAAAEYMEKLTESEISERCTQILRKFLNDPYIPLPKHCVCSRWRSREYSRGSYTYIAVGASQLDIEQIAQPLFDRVEDEKPILLFAGEHTHSTFYSTAHGAYLSGRCAAQILLYSEAQGEVALTCDDTSDLSSWIQGIDLN